MSNDTSELMGHRLLREVTNEGLTIEEAIQAIKDFGNDKRFEKQLTDAYAVDNFTYKC